MKIIIFLTISALSLPFSGIAQMVRVVDKSDLQPVENVAVIGKSYSTTTNRSGVFDLGKFDMDEPLIFKHLAYQVLIISKKEIIASGNKVMLADNVIKLEEVVLSANKILENKSEIPQRIEVIGSRQIAFNNPQTSGDLLQQTSSVFIQQSQMGGSSPVLRGFEANRVLIVVDGVRMNNAIYRSGHLQNVITIDPNMLERVEVVFGPGSVIYGSDAIGGVMSFYSRKPVLSQNKELFVKGGAFTRFSSANQEFAGNINLNLGFKKLAFLTSVSYKNLGDLRMGSNRGSRYPEWGKRLFIAERINGADSMITNNNPNIQVRSGYIQYDILQKILFQPAENMNYMINLQFSNTNDVPRYDRLTEIDPLTNKLKYAEWYYGPQSRFFASFRTELKNNRGIYDNAAIIAAYQNISEDRINRRFNKTAESHQEETVNAFSMNADLMKLVGAKNELRYGVEAVYNHVGSFSYNLNIANNIKTFDNPSRYPDDGSSYTTLAAYMTHNWEISDKLILSQGLRFSSIKLRSAYSDAMMKITKFPFDKEIDQENIAFNGNAGLVFMPQNDWRFAIMGSSGFRAPNVDDVGKVNDSKIGSVVVLPNPELKPEYAYNIDLTLGKTINKVIQLELTGFFTWLRDAVAVKSSWFNGKDSIIWNGKKTAVQTATNSGMANVYGIQGYFIWQFDKKLSLNSSLSYIVGRFVKGDEPLDHIPPMFGMTTLKYAQKKFRSEIFARYNGWKHLGDYSSSGEDNLPQATADGTPPWFTLNIRTAWQLNNILKIQVGMENILDKHYRHFASGISAPGRNLAIALRADF